MKKHLAAVAVFALASVGCQPVAVVTTAPSNPDKDVHISTPRVNVDVEGKGKGGVNVDVHPKDKNP
jgi:hypothetical protein